MASNFIISILAGACVHNFWNRYFQHAGLLHSNKPLQCSVLQDGDGWGSGLTSIEALLAPASNFPGFDAVEREDWERRRIQT